MTGDWPVELRGITESVVATRRPGGPWNVAALGLHAGDPVTARTWGRTRTRRNFRRDGYGVVQFVDDPVDFVSAALAVREIDDPVLDSTAAWVGVEVASIGSGVEGGTPWEEWALEPVESSVDRRAVPTINRGFNAVVEATVWASRRDVAAYDEAELTERVEFLLGVAERCGGPRERAAVERFREIERG